MYQKKKKEKLLWIGIILDKVTELRNKSNSFRIKYEETKE